MGDRVPHAQPPLRGARANGGAEATRLGLSGLQEGPPSINGELFTIANTAQPLSWNPLLYNCAQGHAKLLNDNDQFFLGGSPHTFGGMTPEQRINAAGYPMNLSQDYNGPTTASGFFPGPENVAENLSFGSGPFTGAKLIATILQQHNDLFTDQTVSGRGHRMSTMLTYWREIGIGVNAGMDVGQGNTWDSLYTVQNFGKQVPLQRAAQPAELATAYVMLADPLSSYTSGTTVAVTGGATAGPRTTPAPTCSSLLWSRQSLTARGPPN